MLRGSHLDQGLEEGDGSKDSVVRFLHPLTVAPSRITCDVTLNGIIADLHTFLHKRVSTQFLDPALGHPSEYGPTSMRCTLALSRPRPW